MKYSRFETTTYPALIFKTAFGIFQVGVQARFELSELADIVFGFLELPGEISSLGLESGFLAGKFTDRSALIIDLSVEFRELSFHLFAHLFRASLLSTRKKSVVKDTLKSEISFFLLKIVLLCFDRFKENLFGEKKLILDNIE